MIPELLPQREELLVLDEFGPGEHDHVCMSNKCRVNARIVAALETPLPRACRVQTD